MKQYDILSMIIFALLVMTIDAVEIPGAVQL